MLFRSTSGEQQEETLDPAKSVMLSSQKTEEGADRPVSGGVPGTASNLPSPANNSQNKTSNGIARRTENITYQTSRVVRHTRIPQGVVRRMSLAVLVDQAVQWEGDGANKKKVLVPPTPETLKTIKDLVAGVTGFDERRGDQLIVESLPFESSLNALPPPPVRRVGQVEVGKMKPRNPRNKAGAAIVFGRHRRARAQHSPASAVNQLDLLVQRHLANHQVGARIRIERWIHPGLLMRRLRSDGDGTLCVGAKGATKIE